MIEQTSLRLVCALVGGVTGALCVRPLLHLLQLESYQLPGYFRAIRRVKVRAWWQGVTTALLNLLLGYGLLVCVLGARHWLRFVIWPVCMGAALLAYLLVKHQPAKKALHITPRAKRLYGTAIGVNLAGALLLSLLHPVAALLWPGLSPLWLAVAAWAMQPWEDHVNRSFFRDAQRILGERPGTLRIGITGSYGKTSTKFLLATLLGERYNVLATPASFNTPMGVTRVIREQLKPEHEVFIAEMGARHVGDIREMCELVHPTVGLLTSVGPQHLETFGSIERVAATKYELMEALPADGRAFFAKDGAICQALYEKCALRDKHLVGERLRVEALAAGPGGTRFNLVDGDGQHIACQTKLLGAHNIQNLLLCAEVALALGLTMEQLASGIAKLEPVEHRLQLLATGNGVTVIDDAFNSNPAGAKAALEVLKEFPPRRIIITPGMVELGTEQDALHEIFGRQMAQSVDIAILIGKRRIEPIAAGLRAEGFPQEQLHIVASLAESTALLAKLVRAGDTVLYENDLPENHAE